MRLIILLTIIILFLRWLFKPSQESHPEDSYFFGNGNEFTEEDIMFAEMMEDD